MVEIPQCRPTNVGKIVSKNSPYSTILCSRREGIFNSPKFILKQQEQSLEDYYIQLSAAVQLYNHHEVENNLRIMGYL